VLTAGRLVPIKGFDLAIRAFKKWSQESEARIQDSGFGIQGKTSDNHGSPRAELVIVGEGPERTQLEALARELGLNGQVKFPGWMPRQELLREMTASDVFLFPSLRDGGGLVVVEAMAAGRPVICLDLAGPGLHVTPECGVKVPADSPQQAVRDLAGALDRLYRDARARLQMGRAARQRAREVYDWDRIAERISGIYRDIAPVSD
jgi:glycosyltransferase involved in cell wall biosynthesis